jgi:hypothetical protein
MRHLATLAALCAALALAVGCSAEGNAAGSIDVGTAGPDEVFASLAKGGLEAQALAATDGKQLGSGDCKRGVVKGVETTVCRYADEAAAKAAQPKGLAVVGNATGAALSHGPLLLVVADRDKRDPHGKTINQLTKTFLQK